MTMAMTIVLPEPVAILAQRRWKSPPSEGIAMPSRFAAGASSSHISVSAASSWQKKNRRASNSSGSRQCSNNRLVTPVTPGYPAARHALTRSRIWLTSGISRNTPGSSKAREFCDATMYPAGRRPSRRSNVCVSRRYFQC